MRKVLFLGAVVLGIGFTSCKKEYVCECTTTTAGVSAAPVSTTIKDKKSKAKETCEKGTKEVSSLGVTVKTECKIK